jgi:hypothetical protein
MSDICTVCGKECRGGFEVYERESADGTTEVVIVDSTPDRNFNVCDACNRVTCFACSVNADSGYCNDCYLRFSQQP